MAIMRTMIFMAGKLELALLAAIATLCARPSAIADAAKVSPVDAINHIGQMATLYAGAWPARNTRQTLIDSRRF
jgi:hypothetical protein